MAFEFRVAGCGGHLCDISFEGRPTFDALQAAIEGRAKIPAEGQRLYHGLTELASNEDLEKLLATQVATQAAGHVDVLLVQRSPEIRKWLQELKELPTREGIAFEDDGTTLGLGTVVFNCDPVRWLRTAPPAARESREVVLAAIQQNGSCLQHASPDLQEDRGFVLAAVALAGDALSQASLDFQADREVVLAALRQNGCALKFAAPELRGDRDVVLAALSQNGCALEFAMWGLRADRDVVAAAVAKNALAMCFASEELQGDNNLFMIAMGFG